MEKFYKNIIGTPIMEEGNVRPLTVVKDLVVDPERGKLVALKVDINKNLVIAPIDILAWSDAIFVHSEDSIIQGEDILRVAEIQKKNISFYKNRVYSKDGHYLGRVVDFSIDTKSLMLKKLIISKGIIGLVHFDMRIISSKDIIEVTANKIIVRHNLIKVKAGRKSHQKGHLRIEDVPV